MKQHITGQTSHPLHFLHLIGASRLWATVTMTSVPKTQKISYKKSPPNRMKPAFILRGRGGGEGGVRRRGRIREEAGRKKKDKEKEEGRCIGEADNEMGERIIVPVSAEQSCD